MLDFSSLTRDPENFVPRDNWGASRPLPAFVEPGNLPLGPQPHSGERLVRLNHPRVASLNVYRLDERGGAVPELWVREGVAERLSRVADSLPNLFGLAVFDGWQTLRLQRHLYEDAEATVGPGPWFDDPCADPMLPPSHLTGGAVDVTLTYDMEPLALGTAFNEFGALTATRAFEEQPGVVRDLRRLLYWSLAAEGFVVAEAKWWHFEYGTRRWATLRNQPPIYGATS